VAWVGSDLKHHLVPTPPAMGRDPFHQTRLLRAPSNLALNTASEGAAIASLGNLCHCLITLRVKNFVLVSNLNLPSFSLKHYLLSYHSMPLQKVLRQLSCRPLQVLKGYNKVSPQPSLPSLNNPNSLSISS